MTRLHCLVVGKNEADRYLESSLEWNSKFFDSLFFYDDQSTDDTLKIAARYATGVAVRSSDVSFVDSESSFRQQAWEALEAKIEPSVGDWVVSLDCDEFIVGSLSHSPRELMLQLVQDLNETVASVNCSVYEVWGHSNGYLCRTDGYWAKNRPARMGKYTGNVKFDTKPQACHHLPKDCFGKNKGLTTVSTFSILHFGYYDESDRKRKYEFYSSRDGFGHNPKHIESILKPPTLAKSVVSNLKVYRGRKEDVK